METARAFAVDLAAAVAEASARHVLLVEATLARVEVTAAAHAVATA